MINCLNIDKIKMPKELIEANIKVQEDKVKTVQNNGSGYKNERMKLD